MYKDIKNIQFSTERDHKSRTLITLKFDAILGSNKQTVILPNIILNTLQIKTENTNSKFDQNRDLISFIKKTSVQFELEEEAFKEEKSFDQMTIAELKKQGYEINITIK